MFNVSVNDKKNIYRSKPVMNVDTVPKPLTYDYMPEGYPSKSVENVTLMEEQEVAFSEQNGLIAANSPVDLDIKLGDKLTVVWDGVNYDVVVKERGTSGPGGNLVEKMFGNLALINRGESEDYPFVYYRVSASIEEFYWIAEDAATSHTIKVMRPTVKYAPIDVNYMPEGYPKKNVKIDTSEEQEVAFIGDSDGIMKAQVFIGFEITYGDNLTVVWDGVSYDVVVKNATAGPNTSPGFGNLGLIGAGDTTEHPFACVYLGGICMWGTADTATSHTIKVMRQQETITPMSTDFIPKPLTYDYMPEGYPKKDGWSIEWDGNTEGLTYVPYPTATSAAVGAKEGFYKISDFLPTDNELIGAILEVSNGSGGKISSHQINSSLYPGITVVADSIYIVRQDNSSMHDITFSEKGAYSVYQDGLYVKKLSNETVVPIDNEFLPEPISINKRYVTPSFNVSISSKVQRVETDSGIFNAIVNGNQYTIEIEASGTINLKQNRTYNAVSGITTVTCQANWVKSSRGEYYQFSFSDPVAIGTPSVDTLSPLTITGFKVYDSWFEFQGTFLESSAYVSGSIIAGITFSDLNLSQTAFDKIILWSSDGGSNKRFKITVDDSGAISATEVT